MASVLITELEAFVSREATAVHGAATQLLDFLKTEAQKLEADLMAAKTLLESHGFAVVEASSLPAAAPAPTEAPAA